MSIGAKGTYGTVTVTTSATPIVTGGSQRDGLLIGSATAFYVGFDANVTTSNGFPVAAGQAIDLGDYTGPVYGVTASGTADVRWLAVA